MSSLTPIDGRQLPAAYENAKQALAECARVDECREWADKAAALAVYAKQADDDQLERMALRIRARATRRAGELLKEIEPQHGANQNIKDGDGPKVLTRSDIAREAGLSERQQKTAMRIANVPEQNFQDQIESETPPTLSQLAQQGIKRAAKTLREQESQAKRGENSRLAAAKMYWP